jgi:alpha-glucosidase
VPVRVGGEFVTPWRTIQIADSAVGLINSDIILNLNEPNVLGDVSWVEPGKYVGIWWGMHINTMTWESGELHGATTENAREYIDFAAENGFDGVLIEGWNLGWDGNWFVNNEVFDFTTPYPDFDLEGVAAYARERGVRLVGHHETSAGVSNYEDQMEDAFDLYERLGVRQVKTGYVDDAGGMTRRDADGHIRYEWHDGQFAVNHHLRVLQAAAERRISINAHEPVKDTGLRRTYPNAITREGARGQEYNAWGVPPNPPEHVAILPYTRMLSGPFDYTPGIFDMTSYADRMEGARVSHTLAKELALYVVIYSPVQMVADLPENYERFDDAFDFIRAVPADWEESIALDGEIGEHIVFARQERGSDDWYLGALTDEDPRELSVALDFLEEGRTYTATIWRDAQDAHWDTNPYAYEIEERQVTAADTLDLSLAPGGGAAVRLAAE